MALSVLVIGGLLMRGRPLGTQALVTLFAGFGLVHGAAFAGAITGQEGGAPWPVLVGSLFGLAVIQFVLARVAAALSGSLAPMHARLVGAMVAGAGILLGLEQVEAGVFAVLGL